jgi:hypothetical protein
MGSVERLVDVEDLLLAGLYCRSGLIDKSCGEPRRLRSARRIIDRQDQPPWGAGEATAAIALSAVSNAVFEAVGVRLRSIPFIPAKVKVALGPA